MSTEAAKDRKQLFFIIGPLRTGSSLMARCIDDHPAAICLCESEINQALFKDYYLDLHFRRMRVHGLTNEETIKLLDRKRQEDIPSFVKWYSDISPRLYDLYAKYDDPLMGDKSPDFFRSPKLVQHLAPSYPLIYTVRDPRAILSSIEAQTDAPPKDKEWRWNSLAQNYQCWKPHLDAPNVLVVRYEDLVTTPEPVMRSVYSHLGLPFSTRFLGSFKRLCPMRFLWKTTIDWETGIRRDFDPTRISRWQTTLTGDQIRRVNSNATIVEFMERFGYARDEDEPKRQEVASSAVLASS